MFYLYFRKALFCLAVFYATMCQAQNNLLQLSRFLPKRFTIKDNLSKEPVVILKRLHFCNFKSIR